MHKRLKNERIKVATRHFYERINGLICLKNEAKVQLGVFSQEVVIQVFEG